MRGFLVFRQGKNSCSFWRFENASGKSSAEITVHSKLQQVVDECITIFILGNYGGDYGLAIFAVYALNERSTAGKNELFFYAKNNYSLSYLSEQRGISHGELMKQLVGDAQPMA